MQKATIIFILLGVWVLQSYAQPTGYYNGTEGLAGEDLKTALHEVIDDHVQFSYFASKTIFKFSDVDPENPDNVILVYTGRSNPNNDYGTGGNFINREHVWAKSHGSFADVPPMYNDVHNLKPADASVNSSRSYKDFDNGGEQHPEATECYYTTYSWEARDAVKGDIARIIFYMDARYEGGNGESNLTVVDEVNTFPLPEHGKLSTLLEWNAMDPPDDFERNRNNVIFSWQKNRNPFIDNPEYADLIWGGQQVSPILFANFINEPGNPSENEAVVATATVLSSAGPITEISLHWGLDFENLVNSIPMTELGNDDFSAEIPGQNGSENVYYQIVASDGTNASSSITYNYYVAPIFNGQITTIYDIQGQTDDSPFAGEVVSTTGVVTANFGDSYFVQDGFGEWNGLYIYDAGRNPSIGDSIVITGFIEEYYGKTELKDISTYYHISSNNNLPEPAIIATNGGSEPYESVLIKVSNAVCTDDDYVSNFYMWKVNDGSGEMAVHNTSIFEYSPELNEAYDITGPLNYDFDEWKIELRYESDVKAGTDLIPPVVYQVISISDTVVKVTFNESVEEVSAETIENYVISGNVDVIGARRHTLQYSIVYLDVTSMETGQYTITISNVKDIADNMMETDNIDFDHQSSAGVNDLFSQANISIYPNPASDNFTINISSVNTLGDEFEILISNLAGQTIIKKQYSLLSSEHVFNVNTSLLNKGLYFIKIKSGARSGVEKLLIK